MSYVIRPPLEGVVRDRRMAIWGMKMTFDAVHVPSDASPEKVFIGVGEHGFRHSISSRFVEFDGMDGDEKLAELILTGRAR